VYSKLYRPGQTTHYKGYVSILDRTGGGPVPSGSPDTSLFAAGTKAVYVNVNDPTGRQLEVVVRPTTVSGSDAKSGDAPVDAKSDEKKQGAEADKKKGLVPVDSSGHFSFDIDWPKADLLTNLGSFTVRVSAALSPSKGNEHPHEAVWRPFSHYDSCLVEEFRTPEFEITVARIADSSAPAASALATTSAPLCFGDAGLFQTKAAYYSGGALPFTTVSVEAKWNPYAAGFAPAGFDGFQFTR
jgi:hypothetical protein